MLRGSPNSVTLPVASSKLATIIVSVRRPRRPGPGSPPRSTGLARAGRAVALPGRARDPAGDGGDQPVAGVVAVAVPRLPRGVLAREDRGHQVTGLEVVEG